MGEEGNEIGPREKGEAMSIITRLGSDVYLYFGILAYAAGFIVWLSPVCNWWVLGIGIVAASSLLLAVFCAWREGDQAIERLIEAREEKR